MRRPAPLTAVLAALAAGAGAFAALSVGGDETVTAQERTVTVARGVVQTLVSGSGNLTPVRELDVGFETSGTISEVAVRAGEHVNKGEVLGRLDDGAARVALAQARADLQTAQDTLAQVTGSSGASDTAAAGDAELRTVYAAAPATTTTAPSTTTTPATTTTAPSTTTTPAPAATTPATATTTPTTTTPRRASGSRTSTGASSSGSGTSAGASGSGTSGGSSSGSASGSGSQVSEAAASAAVESARLAVRQAEEALEDTVLRAPFSGTVAEVSGRVGDAAGGGASSSASSSGSGGQGATPSGGTSTASSSSGAFVVLTRVDRFRMEVSLTESDIGKVKKGQPATVTVNAASGARFAAHVTAISVLSSTSSSTTSSSSAVSYPVTLTLDQTGTKLKAGMSATADIVTAEASGLVVPSQALQGSAVTVDRDGERTTRRVQTGVAGETSTIVTSGLAEGDVVVVRSSAASAGAAAAGAGGASGAAGASGQRSGQQQRGLGGAGGGFPGGGFPGGGPPAGGPGG